MTFRTLILRSFRYHARSHLGALLGAAVGSAVLIGALVVGDSVRESLRRMALARLGSIELALASNDRFFRAQLAEALIDPLAAPAAPVLQLLGTAAAGDGSARANRVQLLGVSERFWGFGLESVAFPAPGPGEAVLNGKLAEQLKVQAGETILIRVPKPAQLSREAPISPQEDSSIALRVTVRAVAPDEQMGRFSLQANQVAPFNAFVSLAWLQERIALPERANLLLVGKGSNAAPGIANTLLRRHWQLADAELELRALPEGRGFELRSPRVFLDPPVAAAAINASSNASGLLTYFVNELRLGDRRTPYSMVTALSAPPAGTELRDDETLINQWLADDLQAKPGDELQMTYFTVGLMRQLEERSARFRIRAVLPMEGPTADRTLMPDFPGLANAENCREWDTGFSIDLNRIREKDNQYWEDFKGTPKAFVTLAAGQTMWSNRFGNLTAIRYAPGTDPKVLEEKLRASLDPASVGMRFEPVRAQAMAASSQSQDFGQLFLGFSFFLIAAALLLMGLMFQFGIERRTNEVGTLLALGFTPRLVRRVLLCEGAVLALLGAIAGTLGGGGYAQAMLYGLSTIWRQAVGTSGLQYHHSFATLAMGAAASVAVALATLWLVLRKQAQQPAYELLADGAGGEFQISDFRFQINRALQGVVWGSGALALLIVAWAIARQAVSSGAFFGVGTLLLISSLSSLAGQFAALARADNAAKLNMRALALRNCARRRLRSLATLGLLACGSFLIVAIGAFRLESDPASAKRVSGTGGFTLVGETALPVLEDLNRVQGRELFGLDTNVLVGVEAVPLRVRDGEDASCLNLNRAQKPRLLGVQPDSLHKRGAFTFARIADGLPKENPWRLLQRRPNDAAVPAIGDQASIQWALGRKVGDTLDYVDERGGSFKVRLVAAVANSILQGNLLIGEEEFAARFPSEEGYRMFLIDAPSNQVDSVSAALTRGLQNEGLELTLAARRLAEFNAVQNTYLNTFQVLGGLGLLLGSVGLGVVVLRNVLERRGELALLLAVGFRARQLKWLVAGEHAALLGIGLAIGLLTALVAVLPPMLSAKAEAPYVSLGLTLGAVLVSGVFWTWLATTFALRGKLLEALRNE